jgi:hypothetical protein
VSVRGEAEAFHQWRPSLPHIQEHCSNSHL